MLSKSFELYHKALHVNMILVAILLLQSACSSEDNPSAFKKDAAYQVTKNINYNNTSVDIIIDKPEGKEFDILIVFHGTVNDDRKILQAAGNILNVFKEILDREDMMIISVAYPQENLLFGDNIRHSEAALLWVKNYLSEELDVHVNKIFLAGHSQGGYIVTRLNTMHRTHGVISNAPGPLNLVFRCQLEEEGKLQPGQVCSLLREHYGPTKNNSDAYMKRSLLNYTQGFMSDILFVQGLEDSPIQMYSWPIFKKELLNCADCQDIRFFELPVFGHNALFSSSQAKIEFNHFINSR